MTVLKQHPFSIKRCSLDFFCSLLSLALPERERDKIFREIYFLRQALDFIPRVCSGLENENQRRQRIRLSKNRLEVELGWVQVEFPHLTDYKLRYSINEFIWPQEFYDHGKVEKIELGANLKWEFNHLRR